MIKTKEKKIKQQGKATNSTKAIKLLVDFSVETLQAWRDWQEIFKMIKGKVLQLRIIYLTRHLFRFDGEQKLYRQAKAKRVQHHETSFTTNIKETSR